MTTEIDTLVSSLQREITGLSSSSTEDSVKQIAQQLQDLCSRLATNPEEQISEQTQHTFRALEPSLTTPTDSKIQKLTQSHQLTELFSHAVYLSDQSHKSKKLEPDVLQAIKSYHHPLRIVPPKPLHSNPLNKEQVELWLAAHPEGPLREALRAAIDAITHISQEEFEATFSESIQSFNKQIAKDLKSTDKGGGQDEEPHYVALTWPGKSQQWMLEMALPQLSILPREVLNLKNFREEIVWFVKNQISLEKIVIFDDGIYTGAQIQTTMSNIIDNCFSLSLPSPQFYIVCPFITEDGHSSTAAFVTSLMRSITFSDHKTIPAFHEEISKLPNGKTHWNKLVNYLQLTGHPYLKSLSLYYFDHKIPDKTSSLITFLADGLVRDSKGEVVTQEGKPIQGPLIPKTQPPYHLF